MAGKIQVPLKDFFLRQRLFSDKDKEYPEIFITKVELFVVYRLIIKDISNGNNKSSDQKESFLRKTFKNQK